MATALRSSLENLVRDFANEVLKALRTASLSDLATETGRGFAGGGRGRPSAPAASSGGSKRGGRGGRRRRSAQDIESVTASIVSLLQSHPDGLRAEQIRAELGIPKNELPRPIQEALTSGRVSKTGEKRATRYFVGGKRGGGGGKKGAAGGGKKRGRRRGKKKA